MSDIEDFLCKQKVIDIHSGNTGEKDNTWVLCDYGGFNN